MSTTIGQVISAIALVLVAILGAKLWGPEARKTKAEGRGSDADAAKVMSEASVFWVQEWREDIEELRDYVDALEGSLDEWSEWFIEARRMIREGADEAALPPPPKRPRRPRHPPRPSRRPFNDDDRR